MDVQGLNYMLRSTLGADELPSLNRLREAGSLSARRLGFLAAMTQPSPPPLTRRVDELRERFISELAASDRQRSG